MSTSEQLVLQKLDIVALALDSEGCLNLYSGITKSINILKNRDVKAYAKIYKLLQDDFRMIYDNGHGNSKVDKDIDDACQLAANLASI